MSLSGILKLTGWITLLLLVSLPVQVFTIQWDQRIDLPQDTKAHINHLYDNPYFKRLINDPEYQELYLTVVFRHFREDFERNGIGGWSRSHWPIILQALDLLPIYYRIKTKQDKFKLRFFWQTWRPNNPAEPIPHYGRTAVRIPSLMTSVFKDDVANFADPRTVPYAYLVRQMQDLANSLDNQPKVNNLRKNVGKKLSFKAIYWLTVIDQFIGTVQFKKRNDSLAPPRCPFPRTELVLIKVLNLAPHPAGSRQAGPRAPPPAYPLAQPGPSGSNAIRRGPSAAANAPSRGTKRKATHQGGPSQGGQKRGPGGSMRSMDGASKEPQVGLQAHQANSGGSCTALAWISVILVTVAVSLMSFV